MKREFLVMSVVALALLSSFFILFMPLNEPPKMKQGVVIHINNNYYKILPNEEGYDKLSEECMNILKSINGQYKLAITLDELNSIKSRENYVEIVFPENITLTTNYESVNKAGGIKLKGAVLMLSGEYKGKIFTYRDRVVGVWSSDQSFDRLRGTVETFIQQ
ncbi:hypothetical protein Arcve_1777 [Archaeoglobus veneficus SNP6]|uniref:Uncharacterized protein n=2 Tax=Archaeoglobus veneficus TaxID=58290 RepID=F2KQW8_ARCVS|nr:hypothetical protein Arcve_1777 [Archaeoglobus veneficus SNP6]